MTQLMYTPMQIVCQVVHIVMTGSVSVCYTVHAPIGPSLGNTLIRSNCKL
jgi:hypothetical protein